VTHSSLTLLKFGVLVVFLCPSFCLASSLFQTVAATFYRPSSMSLAWLSFAPATCQLSRASYKGNICGRGQVGRMVVEPLGFLIPISYRGTQIFLFCPLKPDAPIGTQGSSPFVSTHLAFRGRWLEQQPRILRQREALHGGIENEEGKGSTSSLSCLGKE